MAALGSFVGLLWIILQLTKSGVLARFEDDSKDFYTGETQFSHSKRTARSVDGITIQVTVEMVTATMIELVIPIPDNLPDWSQDDEVPSSGWTYRVKYMEQGGDTISPPTLVMPGESLTRFSLTRLKPSTTYDISIQLYSPRGTEVSATNITVSTANQRFGPN